MSKEHFWSSWSASYLPDQAGQKHIDELHTFTRNMSEQVHIPRIKERDGSATTKKVRVVCKSCNNGWMSGIDAAAKPFLVPLIAGDEFQLSLEGQKLVALWIAMKVMVSEHAEENTVMTPASDRRRLMEGRDVPDYYSIRIGKHSVQGLYAAFHRHSATLVRAPKGSIPPPPSDGLPRNIQDVSFVFGSLFVNVLAARDGGFLPRELLGVSDEALPSLHPAGGVEINWPPKRIIDRRDLPNVINGLAAVISGPGVRWFPRAN